MLSQRILASGNVQLVTEKNTDQIFFFKVEKKRYTRRSDGNGEKIGEHRIGREKFFFPVSGWKFYLLFLFYFGVDTVAK